MAMQEDESDTIRIASPRAERIAILKLSSDQFAQERRSRIPPPPKNFMVDDKSIDILQVSQFHDLLTWLSSLMRCKSRLPTAQ